MDFLSQNKVGIGIAIGVLALIGAYLAFFRDSETALLDSTQQNIASPVSRELLVTLGDLRTVRLNDALFSNPVFDSLVDFGVEIPLQPVGRRNPFEPFSATPRTATQTTQTQPSQAPR